MSSLQEHIARYERAKAAEAAQPPAEQPCRLNSARTIDLPDYRQPLPQLDD